jgi:hypothetical protein
MKDRHFQTKIEQAATFHQDKDPVIVVRELLSKSGRNTGNGHIII